jgi:hypothetical protein
VLEISTGVRLRKHNSMSKERVGDKIASIEDGVGVYWDGCTLRDALQNLLDNQVGVDDE